MCMWLLEPVDGEFRSAEIYNSNIGHHLSSLHTFLSEKIDTLSEADREELGALPSILLKLDDLCENIPRHSSFLPAAESAQDRRRKTGSLPTISINENQRSDPTRVVERRVPVMRVEHQVVTMVTQRRHGNPFQYGHPLRGKQSLKIMQLTPSQSLKITTQYFHLESKDNSGDESARRRSLPVVPEESIPSIPGGRQMSDPTSYTVCDVILFNILNLRPHALPVTTSRASPPPPTNPSPLSILPLPRPDTLP
eukprot:sb/3468704/